MNRDFTKKLKREVSENSSGEIQNLSKIKILKEENYCIIPFNLGGDAPKRFIKAYFFEKDGRVYKSKFKTWKSYIAKSAEKWYPHESIVEYMLNRFGEELGLKMNGIKLSQINGQIRFLSEYFLDRENEELTHGAEICGEYLEDNVLAKEIANDKRSARELFTFEFIVEAINSVFSDCCEELILEFVRMLTYDAIVGNNDRHFYNWGVIKKTKKDSGIPKFSPIYDTARGLLWNWSDQLIVRQLQNLNEGGKKVDNYIMKASPRVSIEDNSEINHFDLIEYIWNSSEKYHGTISGLISFEYEERILELYDLEFKRYFIEERSDLIRYIIKERFDKLRNITNNND